MNGSVSWDAYKGPYQNCICQSLHQLLLHCLFWLMELNKLCSLVNKAIPFPNVCTSKAFVPFLTPLPTAGVKYIFGLSLTRVLYGQHIFLALFMFLNILHACFPLIQSWCCRLIKMTSQWAPCLKSPSSRLLGQPFAQPHIKDDIKTARHWPLGRNPQVTGGFPSQRIRNASCFFQNIYFDWHISTSTKSQ